MMSLHVGTPTLRNLQMSGQAMDLSTVKVTDYISILLIVCYIASVGSAGRCEPHYFILHQSDLLAGVSNMLSRWGPAAF